MLQEAPKVLDTILGLGVEAREITAWQAALRAIVVYGFTLIIVRLGRQRLLGRATAFDVIFGIMIGSVMSRGINSSAGLVPTLAGGTMLVVLHAVFSSLAYHTSWVGNLVKGNPVLLVEDGRIQEDAMRGTSLSGQDLAEALRLEGNEPDPSAIRLAYLERNGTISIVTAAREPRILRVAVEDGVQTVRISLE